LTLAVFVINLPLNMLNSVYSAYQDGFVSSVWGIAGNVVALVSLVVVTQFHGGLPLLVIALSGTRIVVAMGSGWYAFHVRYPWLAPAPSAVRWSCIRRLLTLGGKYMVSQLASLGIYQSQPIIITQLLGPAQVTTFVIAYKIIALPVDLAYMATMPFVSAFAEAKARGDWKWIRGAYWNSTLASVVIGIPVVVSIAIVAKHLIRIWAGPAAIPGSALILWLTIYTLISVALMSAGAMLSGLESVGKLALSLMLCALGIIGAGIPFARWWGLSGIAFAMAINKVVTFWPILAYEIHRLLRASTASHTEDANQPTRCADGEFIRAEG
jgi:O-antigen/teichoic acid export membrane protein